MMHPLDADGLSVPIDREFLPQTEHNCFDHNTSGNVDYSFLTYTKKYTSPSVCSGSHKFVHCSRKEKKQLGNVVHVEERGFQNILCLCDMSVCSMLELCEKVIKH